MISCQSLPLDAVVKMGYTIQGSEKKKTAPDDARDLRPTILRWRVRFQILWKSGK